MISCKVSAGSQEDVPKIAPAFLVGAITSVPTLFEQIQLVSGKGPKVIGDDFVK